ncbi:hypothetical protein EAD89_06605 [Micromonospora sp. BL4]|nr:hypothetical protein EAD89_06605 [Micromonospora sp. BL4]
MRCAGDCAGSAGGGGPAARARCRPGRCGCAPVRCYVSRRRSRPRPATRAGRSPRTRSRCCATRCARRSSPGSGWTPGTSTVSDPTAGPALAGVTPPLPSPALGRFVAAVTAVVGTSVFGWQTVLIDAARTRQRAECIDGLRGLPAPIDVRTGTVNEESAAAVRHCLGTLHADAVRQMLVGMAVLAAVTAVIYLAAPWCERRLRDLRRLDRMPGTETLRADLSALVREAGLRRAPTFVASRSARVSGNTFGAFPVRYVRLDLGLVHAHRVAPGVFRAVVLHELAHLRNADVGLTRLTIALAWAFPLAVLVPVAVNYAGAVPAAHLLDDVWRLATFALVVQVSAWSVLRAREFAADARLTGADAATIRALLATNPTRAGRWPRLAAMFRFQPLARARADELDRPVRRVSARPVEALGAGLAAGIAAPPLADLMAQLPRTLGGPDPLTGGAFLVGLLLGVPLALVTTGALWRSAWWARHGGGTAAGGGLFGAALAVGLLVGRRLAWSAAYASDRPAWWVELAWAVLGIAAGVLLGRWVALGARAHLRRIPVTDAGRTRLAWAGAATATALLIAAFVASILILDSWSADSEVSMLRVLAAREGHPEHVTVLTLGDTLGWYVRVLADHAPYLLALPLAAALHPVLADRHATRRALRLGIVSGVVGAVALPLVVVGIAVAARDPGLGPAALRSLVDGHTLLPVTLVEMTVAVAAVANRRLSVWHALLAAGTAGLLLAPVLVAAMAALPCLGTAAGPGCVRPPEQVLAVRAISHALLVAPVFATLAAALGAAVTAALTVVVRPRHRRWLTSGAAVLVLLGASGAVAAAHRTSGPAAVTGHDGCLVGVWRLAAGRYHVPVPADSPLGTITGLRQDASVDLTSGPETGFASAYRIDGTATDLFDRAAAEGLLNGHTVRNVRRGMQTYRWTAHAGRYRQRDGVTAGDVNLLRVGDRELDISSVMADSEGSYRCAGDRLVIRMEADDGSWGEEIFVRSGA